MHPSFECPPEIRPRIAIGQDTLSEMGDADPNSAGAINGAAEWNADLLRRIVHLITTASATGRSSPSRTEAKLVLRARDAEAKCSYYGISNRPG